MPTISLLMPCRNAAPFLAETWSTLKGQSLEDWELIVVDDHSDDGSFGFWQERAKDDARVRLFQNPGRGILPALQFALSQARGLYLGRCDADDRYPAQRLAHMLAALKTSERGTLITGTVEYFGSSPVSKGYLRYQQWLNQTAVNQDFWRQIYRECCVASPNWLMRRSDLLSVGGFTGLRYPEDYDLLFRWYAAGFQIECLKEVTLYWREHPMRTSRNSPHYKQKSFFKLKLERFVELEKPEKLVLWGARRKGRLSAKILQKLGCDFEWMELNPEFYPHGVLGHPVSDYRKLQPQPGLKLLIAVYPSPAQRKELEDFLAARQFRLGEDYWYL